MEGDGFVNVCAKSLSLRICLYVLPCKLMSSTVYVKRKEPKKAEEGFIELLKIVGAIMNDSKWKDVHTNPQLIHAHVFTLTHR